MEGKDESVSGGWLNSFLALDWGGLKLQKERPVFILGSLNYLKSQLAPGSNCTDTL